MLQQSYIQSAPSKQQRTIPAVPNVCRQRAARQLVHATKWTLGQGWLNETTACGDPPQVSNAVTPGTEGGLGKPALCVAADSTDPKAPALQQSHPWACRAPPSVHTAGPTERVAGQSGDGSALFNHSTQKPHTPWAHALPARVGRCTQGRARRAARAALAVRASPKTLTWLASARSLWVLRVARLAVCDRRLGAVVVARQGHQDARVARHVLAGRADRVVHLRVLGRCQRADVAANDGSQHSKQPKENRPCPSWRH